MNLNALLRGQSNAFLLGVLNGKEIVKHTESLLGFDGVNDRVTLQFAHDRGSAGNTVYSGTAFLSDWVKPTADGGWQVAALEQGLLNYINGLPPAQKADPTAVVWLHNEYDSIRADLSPATWESAVRFDAALVRQAFGKAPAEMPYLFVSAIPYSSGTAAGHQAIRMGMENLAADPAFNAGIAARVQDVDMSWEDLDKNPATPDYGGPHMSFGDSLLAANRIAVSLAEEWAAYAKPGSPVALAGGNVGNLGPQVVQARLTGPDHLTLNVAFDAASSLRPLDDAATRGVGWSVIAPDGSVVTGAAAALATDMPDTLYVRFDGPIPAGGKLYYGHGVGRLAAADGSGAGHAVYDNHFLPMWVPASGLGILGPQAMALPEAAVGSVLQVGAEGGTWTGTAAAENWVLLPESGAALIYGFDSAADTLSFSGIAPNSLIYWDPATIGIPGLGLTWAGGKGGVILPGLDRLPDSQMMFA
ncbi:hypothetical protein [Roseicella aerolata]|uniref:Uncharacterized protein n=1 Tax=Roseicella aerolata TaxID=2883479 RepID=A0A9X1IEP7_9PROT|nr:hypothetical protein [Roseicella aerolata]MCB4822826.1 hypothetical protein [Roseicella aerolata]